MLNSQLQLKHCTTLCMIPSKMVVTSNDFDKLRGAYRVVNGLGSHCIQTHQSGRESWALDIQTLNRGETTYVIVSMRR